jgi:hypothetical protein
MLFQATAYARSPIRRRQRRSARWSHGLATLNRAWWECTRHTFGPWSRNSKVLPFRPVFPFTGPLFLTGRTICYILGKTSLADVALRSMCTLLTEATHFNFRVNLMSSVVARLSKKSWDQVCPASWPHVSGFSPLTPTVLRAVQQHANQGIPERSYWTGVSRGGATTKQDGKRAQVQCAS